MHHSNEQYHLHARRCKSERAGLRFAGSQRGRSSAAGPGQFAARRCPRANGGAEQDQTLQEAAGATATYGHPGCFPCRSQHKTGVLLWGRRRRIPAASRCRCRREDSCHTPGFGQRSGSGGSSAVTQSPVKAFSPPQLSRPLGTLWPLPWLWGSLSTSRSSLFSTRLLSLALSCY